MAEKPNFEPCAASNRLLENYLSASCERTKMPPRFPRCEQPCGVPKIASRYRIESRAHVAGHDAPHLRTANTIRSRRVPACADPGVRHWGTTGHGWGSGCHWNNDPADGVMVVRHPSPRPRETPPADISGGVLLPSGQQWSSSSDADGTSSRAIREGVTTILSDHTAASAICRRPFTQNAVRP